MTPILFRAGARYHLRHPWQLLLALLGVTLGVAVVVAVDVANSSARNAFLLSTETVSGRATHEIVGGPAGLPASLYPLLRVGAGLDSLAPIIDRYVRLSASPPGVRADQARSDDRHDTRADTRGGMRVMRLLGVDPFAEAPFRPWVAPAAGRLDFTVLLTRRALLMAAPTADRLGLAVGDEVEITAGTRSTTALLAGVLEPADDLARRALADIIIADMATAQELAGATGVLDRIELRIAGTPAGQARLDSVRGLLPPGTRLLETGTRAGATARLTRAFETNLAALALVALVFGMFLIYNSVTFSLVQRRPLIGLLRAQGVTAREIFTLVLLEAALLGTVATAIGLAAGAALGGELVRLVSRTINDLYFTVAVTSTRVDALTVAKGALLGIGATLAAALAPAREAVRAQPRAALARSTLERSVRGSAARFAAAGGILAAVAATALLVPSRSLVLGFGALFVLILAAALLTPGATLLLMAAVRPAVASLGPVARMASRGVSASLSRTAPAIAALSVAIAVGIAVTIMIGSFRGGVIAWLDRSLQADLYISAPDIGADRTDASLDPALPVQVAALDGVAGISTYRHTSLLLQQDIVRLIAVDLYTAHHDAFELLDGSYDDVWRSFGTGGVLISEPLAFRRGLRAGDTLALPTDRGDVEVQVAGAFRDYASEHGVIFMDRAAYDGLWDDDAITSLGVFLDAGVDGDSVLDLIRALPAAVGIVGRSNRGLRESTLVVFDRTFVITGVLRLLALIVAFVGVTGALMALQLERAREIGVLRTTGLTPAQVWALVCAQTGLMGLAAAVLALPLGLAMAWAMVHVINRRAFGWSFEMLIGVAPFTQAILVGLGAALLAGLYPAWRMARIRPAIALREE
ncbi:FtsX-like permease family protein [soil metagenome]